MEVEVEFRGLISISRGMLSANEASEVLEFVEARDYVLALEALCGTLLDGSKHVTPELFYRINSLVRQLDGVDPRVIERVKAIVRAE